MMIQSIGTPILYLGFTLLVIVLLGQVRAQVMGTDLFSGID